MARPKNDGKGRLGGRAKGTPNKVTSNVREWICQVVNKNRKQMERDLKELLPKERLQILERLISYVVPKQQSVSANIELESLSEIQLDKLINELTNNAETTNDYDNGENTD